MKRVRVTYTKSGVFLLMGHLDSMAHIDKAFRRMDLDFITGQGYKRKIKFSSSPALSLGMESECEYIDVKLIKDYPEAVILDQFQKHFPPGLKVEKIEIFLSKPPQPRGCVYEKKYRLFGLFNRMKIKTIVFGSGEKIQHPAKRIKFIF